MKKLIPVLILIGLLLVTGCSSENGGPPKFTVINPNVIPDGSGGFIVAYQINNERERTTYVQRLGAQGNSLWGEKGIVLYPDAGGFRGNTGEEVCAPLMSDGKGNFIVIWPSGDALWAQKLDVEGHSLWQADKVKISGDVTYFEFQAISDNSGGAIIGWPRNGWPEKYYSIGLQRMDGEGKVLWNSTISTPELMRFDIASDANGNAFIIWQDNSPYNEGDIFVQKVDADGQVTWPSDGLLLIDIHKPGYGETGSGLARWIVSDGAGGAIAIWIHIAPAKDKGVSSDLYAQRINAEGEMLWESGGVLVTRQVWGTQLVNSDSGGYIIFWHSGRSIYAQRLDSTGTALWPESGIQVGQSGASVPLYYHVIDDGSGGAVVVWNGMDSGNDVLYAQRIDSSGKNLWGDDGVLVSKIPPYWSSYSTPARISKDGYGGFIIAWAAGEHFYRDTSSYIQRISADGEILWGEKGIRLDQ